jgi:hypothetical protein
MMFYRPLRLPLRSRLERMASKPRRTTPPQPPEAMSRLVKSLLAVPAEEIEEQKAIYEREKRERQRKHQSPGPRPAA